MQFVWNNCWPLARHCVGKTVSDEVAFSLIGENHFYGTPLNPRAPDRVPGGSSSGSVSAVACGLADLALGTDTGGSVRFPASNCGVWGLRPSHDFISVAGVMPFAPTFDTIGVHAQSADILAKAAGVLLGAPDGRSADSAKPTSIYLLREAFELAQPDTRAAHQPAIDGLRKLFGTAVQETSLGEILGDAAANTFDSWFQTYCTIQWAEIEDSLGPWIAESKPEFGPVTAKNLELVRKQDRRTVPAMIVQREFFYRALRKFLGPTDLLCIPTTPARRRLRGAWGWISVWAITTNGRVALTSIAGIGRLPQVSMPVSSLAVDGVELPLGLSLLGSFGEDLFLLDIVQQVATALPAS